MAAGGQQHPDLKLGWRHSLGASERNILIAEDDPISRAMLSTFFKKKGIVPLVGADGEEAIALAEKHPFDISLVLVDWMMPRKDGLQVIRHLRESEKHPYLYCILLTAKDAKEDVVAGFEAGTDDYITKPFDFQELWARVLTGLRIRRLMVELEAKNRVLNELALRDPLTELLNRRALEGVLETEVARSARHGRSLGVAMVDVDHFKIVNDTYGHAIGDQVLKSFADTLRSTVRMMDTVARYGGEEFVIIFPETGRAGCQIVAERLRQNVEANTIKIGDAQIRMTASLGFAVGVPAKGNDRKQGLVEIADNAMYEAKGEGRNRWVIKTFGESH